MIFSGVMSFYLAYKDYKEGECQYYCITLFLLGTLASVVGLKLVQEATSVCLPSKYFTNLFLQSFIETFGMKIVLNDNTFGD